MSFIAAFIAKKILAERLSNSFGQEDPYFESVPATRLDGRPTGKVKKRKKALPPGISEHDGRILTKVKRRAYRLDMSLFSLCGIRFGWSSVIGIVPAIGDALDALMAVMVFRTCSQVEGGLPAGLRSRMIFNIMIDFIIGLVPFIGDVADAAFRCNTKNAILLEEHLREQGKKNLVKSGQPVPSVDPSDPVYFDQADLDGPDEYVDRQPSQRNPAGRHHNTSSTTPARTQAATREGIQAGPTVPASAHTREPRQASRGWFSWGRGRAADEEMGPGAGEPQVSGTRAQRPQR